MQHCYRVAVKNLHIPTDSAKNDVRNT